MKDNEMNRLSDEELNEVSGGYVVEMENKFFAVSDKDGSILGNDTQKMGFADIEEAKKLAGTYGQLQSPITEEEWLYLKVHHKLPNRA